MTTLSNCTLFVHPTMDVHCPCVVPDVWYNVYDALPSCCCRQWFSVRGSISKATQQFSWRPADGVLQGETEPQQTCQRRGTFHAHLKWAHQDAYFDIEITNCMICMIWKSHIWLLVLHLGYRGRGKLQDYWTNFLPHHIKLSAGNLTDSKVEPKFLFVFF